MLSELSDRHLAYLHIGVFDDSLDGRVSDYVRKNYPRTLVGVGGFSAETGLAAINQNRFDLLAIGRPFIANPDYISKVQQGDELVSYNDDMLKELI